MAKQMMNEPTEFLKQDEVELGEIFVDPSRNMRRYSPSAKEVESLANDIRERGQLQPVVVRLYSKDDGENYKYELVAGYNRYAAMESLVSAGFETKILVRVVDAEDQGAMFANISENIKRNSVSIIDLSYAIGKLKDGASTTDEEGSITVTAPAMTLKDIASALGLSHGNVSEIEKMRLLRSNIQKKIHTGDITKDMARQLIKMSEDEQDEVLAKLESGEATNSELVQVTKATKTKKKKRASKGKGKGAGEGEGDGEGDEGEGGNGRSAVKRALSSKVAILVMEELSAKPEKGEDGTVDEGSEADISARDIFKQFKRFLEGKIGGKALVKQVLLHLE